MVGSADESSQPRGVLHRASELNAWAEVREFRTSIETEALDDEDDHDFFGSDIRHEPPEDLEIPLSRGEEIFIRFTCQSDGQMIDSTPGGRRGVVLGSAGAVRVRVRGTGS
jgi:hypothetical protein